MKHGFSMKKLKGQVAIIGIMFAFMLVLVMAIIMSPLMQFVELGVNATSNSTHGALMATMINYMPVFIVLVVLIAIAMMITGRMQ